MLKSGKTTTINELMMHCDNIEDFKADILSRLTKWQEMWKSKINEIIAENNYSKSDIAKLCQVSRAAVLKWCNGALPQSREMFIRIGFAAGYNLDEMNLFLMRFGRYPELYPKSPEDCVYIFVLNSKTIEHSYSACQTIFNKISDVLEKNTGRSKEKKEADIKGPETKKMLEYLLTIDGIDELRSYLEENIDMFTGAFEGFYSYVREFVRKNNNSYLDDIKQDNINNLADTLGWSSSLRKCVYNIYAGNYFPIRGKVISLGLHLNMNVEEINRMLSLAKMEPLYVINPSECAIVYAVYDAELDDVIYEGTDDLLCHVNEIFAEIGMDELELCEV